jgi:hypothetical protein
MLIGKAKIKIFKYDYNVEHIPRLLSGKDIIEKFGVLLMNL